MRVFRRQAEIRSHDDCLLRRGDHEASEGPRERPPPDFELHAHDQRVTLACAVDSASPRQSGRMEFLGPLPTFLIDRLVVQSEFHDVFGGYNRRRPRSRLGAGGVRTLGCQQGGDRGPRMFFVSSGVIWRILAYVVGFPAAWPPHQDAGAKRQEWRKSSNPRQAAPCSVNTILTICKAGIWRMSVNGGN
jgi:hypothetical protein